MNVLVLALVTRRHRVPLMWSMMGGPGNSSTAARIALMDRHLALFGAGSVKMLLADREFIGGEWLRYLHENNVSFTIRLKANLTVITEAGQRVRLCTLLRKTRGAGCFRAALPGDGGQAPLMLGFGAKRIKGGELLIVAASKDAHHALTAYRRRWSIECLSGNTRTRGLNLEETSNIIGGIDDETGAYEGLQAFLAAESTVGVAPRILIAPEFSQIPAVIAEMPAIASSLRAVIVADGPNTTDAAAIIHRETLGSDRIYLVDPWVKVWDTTADAEVKLDLSLRYYKRERGGVELIEADPVNMIFRVKGVGQLAEHRANIGR